MRPLIVVCELRHADEIRQAIHSFGHPLAVRTFVSIHPLDLGTQFDPSQFKLELASALSRANQVPGASDKPVICATREVAKPLGLVRFCEAVGVEYEMATATELRARSNSTNRPPKIVRLLNHCGLSLRSAATTLLSGWRHGTIDRAWIDRWLNQFGTLGRYIWIGEAILRNLRMIDTVELGDMLHSLGLPTSVEYCVNRDPRAHGKSGEVLANLLTKRHQGKTIHESPARAIDGLGSREIVLFEDGLWSGTEALGVLDSLRGLRDPGKVKTTPLQAPFADLKITLAYGVATDYGINIVERYLSEHQLTMVRLVAAETIHVASEDILSSIENGTLPLHALRETGPDAGYLNPAIEDVLTAVDVPVPDQDEALEFCTSIGQQLFDSYLKHMQDSKGWTPWPDDKRKICALGMHGLGLLHVFGHSVPKAALPLLWASGPVSWKGRTIDWHPLFQNAWG